MIQVSKENLDLEDSERKKSFIHPNGCEKSSARLGSFIELKEIQKAYIKKKNLKESYTKCINIATCPDAEAHQEPQIMYSYIKYAILLAVEVDLVEACWESIIQSQFYNSLSRFEQNSCTFMELISLISFAFSERVNYSKSREILEHWIFQGGVLDDSMVCVYVKTLIGLQEFQYAVDFVEFSFSFQDPSVKRDLLQLIEKAKTTLEQKGENSVDQKREKEHNQVQVNTLLSSSSTSRGSDFEETDHSFPRIDQANPRIAQAKPHIDPELVLSKKTAKGELIPVPSKTHDNENSDISIPRAPKTLLSGKEIVSLLKSTLPLPPWFFFILFSLVWASFRKRKDRMGMFLRFLEQRLVQTYRMATAIH